MKRILIRRPGGHEALHLVEEPDPQPAAGQVRVRVRAAGVNYADAIVRMGYYEAAKGLYPMTPGFEFAGSVDAVGAGVTRFREGDRVVGFTRFGAYASSIAVQERQLHPCPEGWDFADCAALPAVYLTAYHALFKVAKVEPGETLLVHSAAGGVGTALLQLGRVAGCKSLAVVGAPHKAALCRELGAEAVIDRSSQDLWAEVERHAPGGVDAIFDANGVTTLRKGFEHLAHGGRLVVYGFADILPRGKAGPSLKSLVNYLRVPKFSPLAMTTTNRAVMGFNVVFLFHKLEIADKGMGDLLRWIGEGKIRKVPVTLFPLERAADAHRAIESGTTTGKLVLTA
ncbi:MAG: zinc-binding dehydrogenase [Elusimicrobia bacterium]|nr:zinc-binding dehydrogenase [Elusimicrobiota bacterium]